MSQAVDYLVSEYLSAEYPAVSKALKKEARSTAAPSRSPFGKRSLAEVVLAYRAAAAKKAPIPDSSSDDDEQPVRKPASRKASPKLAAKKAPIPDSSSDDDEQPVRRPAPAQKTARSAADSDSNDVDAVPVKKAAKVEKPAPRRGPHHLNEDGTFRRFQRIDPMKVTFHADALRDNRPGEEHLVLRQNQEMMRTKGKGFNKLKQKNKNKFYGAGVDLSVRAYQFPDSDDE